MSASLVGSEMCIRDSPRTTRMSRLSRSAAICRVWKTACARTAMRSPMPVSYTHLTLPTICSV
eukprot:6124623-Alexandrium_andersonii.AAC.1